MDTNGNDLTARIGRGDAAAVEQAYDAYFTPVMNFVFYTVHDYDIALDISQDAFLKVVSAIQDNRAEVRDFKSYLFGAARNLAINEMRRSAKFDGYPEGGAEPADPGIFADPARAAQLSEQRAQVAAAAARLNENQRIALTLKDIEGWSYGDIGALLGMSSNAVGVLLSRARLKFRREFRLQQIDETQMKKECFDLLPLMCAVLDGEADEADKEALQEHLATCPSCAEAMNEMAGASTTLRALVPLAPVAAVKAALIGKAMAAVAAGAGAGAAGAAGAGAAAGALAGGASAAGGGAAAGAGVGAGVGAGMGAAAGAGAAGAAAGMSTLAKAVITGATALLVAGAGVGSFIGVRRLKDTPPTPATVVSAPAAAPVAATAVEASDRIVFVRDGDVFTVSPDGTGEARLTSGLEVTRLAVSPTGDRLAFQTRDSVIFIMSASGGSPQQVTLPERGRAENPAFSPDEKYLYFTRVKPEDLALIDNNQPYTVTFERYDIAANSVTTVYAKSGIFENGSVFGLFCPADGSELYFNVYGSDWPSSEALKLTLDEPVTESVLLARVRDEANPGSVTCYRVVDTSPAGSKIAFFREAVTSPPEGEPAYVVESCIKDLATGEETVVERREHSGMVDGSIDAVRFSYAETTGYLCSRRTQPSPGQPVLEYGFFSGRTDEPGLAPLGLNLTNIDDWRVLKVEDGSL